MSLLTKAKHLLTGEEAEQDACVYLTKKGLKLITKNYRCRFGEIDIIMQDQQSLVFVEVRYRKHNQYGSGAESVTASKQKKLIRSAQWYLQQHPKSNQYACRFDVVSMSEDIQGGSHIDWIKNAIQA